MLELTILIQILLDLLKLIQSHQLGISQLRNYQ